MKIKHLLGVGLLLTTIIGSTCFLYVFNNKSVVQENIMNGNTSNMFAIMLETEYKSNEYKASDDNEWPKSGYEINEEKSYCENGTKMAWVDNILTVNVTGTEKCYIFFNNTQVVTINDIIIAQYKNNNGCNVTIDSTDNTLVTLNGIADTNEGLCSIGDGMYDGYTYYYRGAVNNNWVKFGKEKVEENGEEVEKDIYWRIIRFNGDGSIRMIYSGTTAPTEDTQYVMSVEKTQIENKEYNYITGRGSAEYVGYYYTLTEGHGTSMPSVVAQTLNDWYEANLSKYDKYIANGKFCNDREPISCSGAGTSTCAFAGRQRIYVDEVKTATSSCNTSSDIFISKVGLITSDEIAFAGGAWNISNTNYYLYTYQIYWTMTPMFQTVSGTAVIAVGLNGNIEHRVVSDSYGVRPVINLKPGTTFKVGDGTWEHPYEVAS